MHARFGDGAHGVAGSPRRWPRTARGCPAPSATASRISPGSCCRAGSRPRLRGRGRSWTCARVSASSSMRSPGRAALRAVDGGLQRGRLRVGEQMVVLDHHHVVEAHAVIVPAAGATAAFSSARRPGVVLRVSRIRAGVPATASTKRRVSVATPESRWRKLSATRSPVRIAAGAARMSDGIARLPDARRPRARCATARVGSTRGKTSAAVCGAGDDGGFLGENARGGLLRRVDEKLDRGVAAADVLGERDGDGIINPVWSVILQLATDCTDETRIFGREERKDDCLLLADGPPLIRAHRRRAFVHRLCRARKSPRVACGPAR